MSHIAAPPTETKSAVLFLTFNRPSTAAVVFNQIREARPSRLYLASDGPRRGVESDIQKISETRKLILNIDWPCQVQTRFHEENLGCKEAVGGAINWFFEHENEGIILEDDTVPNPDFFRFCDSLLERYRHDPRVAAITGDNFQNGNVRGKASYYFSRYPYIWGWASWRRAWDFYDPDMNFWPTLKKSIVFKSYFSSGRERLYWTKIFDKVHSGELSTSWGYAWLAAVFSQGRLTATPNVNLISNIGFGPDSTHTGDEDSVLSNIASQPLGRIKHPVEILLDKEADRYTFDHVFDVGLLQSPIDYAKALVRRTLRLLMKSQKDQAVPNSKNRDLQADR